jgi:GR25 family glycosyltransferase involved in LPS biosynthesis
MNYDFEINIVHYEKLHQRKDSLIRELEGKNIKFNFIEKFDREKLTKENLEKFTNDINNAYKANFLSHIECYKNLLESKYNYTLILEDDSLPKQIFYRKINSYLKQLPKNFDLFYISEGKSNFKIPIYKKIPFKNVYFKKNIYTKWGGAGASKFADGYFVSRNCAKKLLHEFNKKEYKVNTSIDWWKNEIIEQCGLNVYWGEPTLISTNLFDTSFSGKFSQGNK